MRTIEAIADPVATGVETNDMMKALVYGGPGQRTWQSKPKPMSRDAGDAVVRITTSTMSADGPAHPEGRRSDGYAGRVLGHEGVGVIEAVGPLVSTFHRGDCAAARRLRRGGVCVARDDAALGGPRGTAGRGRAASSSTRLSSRARPRPCGIGPSRDGSC